MGVMAQNFSYLFLFLSGVWPPIHLDGILNIHLETFHFHHPLASLVQKVHEFSWMCQHLNMDNFIRRFIGFPYGTRCSIMQKYVINLIYWCALVEHVFGLLYYKWLLGQCQLWMFTFWPNIWNLYSCSRHNRMQVQSSMHCCRAQCIVAELNALLRKSMQPMGYHDSS